MSSASRFALGAYFGFFPANDKRIDCFLACLDSSDAYVEDCGAFVTATKPFRGIDRRAEMFVVLTVDPFRNTYC